MKQPLLKYCGNHSLEDLQTTISSRADFIGVVFAESKRQVTVQQLKDWLSTISLQPHQKLVGVFVNPTIEQLDHILHLVPIDIIQCHGNETVEFIKRIKERYNLPVWKVIHHNENSLEQMKAFNNIANGYVVDQKTKNEWGGTGRSFDWSYVPNYIYEAKKQGVPLMIAGGINRDNISELLKHNPPGIDLSSGIECDGRKNRQQIEQLEKRLS